MLKSSRTEIAFMEVFHVHHRRIESFFNLPILSTILLHELLSLKTEDQYAHTIISNATARCDTILIFNTMIASVVVTECAPVRYKEIVLIKIMVKFSQRTWFVYINITFKLINLTIRKQNRME